MHEHGNSQNHARGTHADRSAGNRKRLLATLVLVAAYMIAEVGGGIVSNSLALLADAGHMLSDVGALGMSLFALWFARRPPDPRRTFGYYRAEILAALLNGATLVAISIYIFVEAYQRFRQPPEVQGAVLMGIAVGGLLVNLAGLYILNAGKGESLNVQGAWLHVLSDTLGSVGAIVAGALVWWLGWNLADPIISVVIGLLVIYSSWNLLKESVAVLMESSPKGIDVDAVRDAIAAVPGVREVHDLHVWSITSGVPSLSAHVVAENGRDYPELLQRVRQVLHEKFDIDHQTIQVEPQAFSEPSPGF